MISGDSHVRGTQSQVTAMIPAGSRAYQASGTAPHPLPTPRGASMCREHGKRRISNFTQLTTQTGGNHMADNTSTPNAEEIAQAVARQLALQEDSSGGQTGPVIVLGEGGVRGDVGGRFTLAIKYNKTTYTLTVQIPTAEDKPYEFIIAEQTDPATPKNIMTFKYCDPANWLASADVPPITFGSNFSIQQLSFSLQEGTVPPSQTSDLPKGPDGATE